MARGKRSVENGSGGIESYVDGPVIETPAEPDHSANGSASFEGFTDPASVGQDGAGDSGQPAKRGRGRPKGSGNKQKAETVRSIGIEGVAGILLTVHSTLAAIARAPELELNEAEAEKIAKASVSVAKLYNVETTEKATAWANLIGVVGAAYVPRFIALNMRRKMEAAERRAGGNMTNFPGAPPIQPRMN